MVVHFHDRDTQHGPLYGTVLFQVSNDLAHDAGGYGKGVTGVVPCFGINGGVDAHQFARSVYQRSAAVTGIDCGIGLDKLFYTQSAVG